MLSEYFLQGITLGKGLLVTAPPRPRTSATAACTRSCSASSTATSRSPSPNRSHAAMAASTESRPLPYLPNNPEYGEKEVKTVIFCYRV